MASVGTVSNQYAKKGRNYPAPPKRDQFQQPSQEYIFTNIFLILNIKYLLAKECKIILVTAISCFVKLRDN